MEEFFAKAALIAKEQNDRLEAFKSDLESKTTLLSTALAKIEQLESERVDLDTETSALKVLCAEKQRDIDQQAQTIASLSANESAKDVESKLIQLQKQYDSVFMLHLDEKNKSSVLMKDNDSMTETMQKQAREIAELAEQLKNQSSGADGKERVAELEMQLLNERSKYEETIASRDQAIANFRKEVDVEIKKEIANAVALRKRELENEYRQKSSQLLANMDKDIIEKSKKIETKHSELTRDEVATLQKKNRTLQEEYDTLTAKFKQTVAEQKLLQMSTEAENVELKERLKNSAKEQGRSSEENDSNEAFEMHKKIVLLETKLSIAEEQLKNQNVDVEQKTLRDKVRELTQRVEGCDKVIEAKTKKLVTLQAEYADLQKNVSDGKVVSKKEANILLSNATQTINSLNNELNNAKTFINKVNSINQHRLVSSVDLLKNVIDSIFCIESADKPPLQVPEQVQSLIAKNRKRVHEATTTTTSATNDADENNKRLNGEQDTDVMMVHTPELMDEAAFEAMEKLICG